MSMLAEPRRKQKWSVDPRNSAWSNDDSKFGQKMLERMGWSKGKGLGRTEQGSTDHIKVSVKNNNYGLGANASHEDNWIAHQDDFNELLAQLNDCHSQNSSNGPAADDQKGFSLEEKSKTSRKRVHYTKFSKGKDLSSRSESDLNCIFGKRSRTSRDPEQDGSSSDSQTDTDGCRTRCDLEPETKTVTSALNMQEYFAQRMAQLKRARPAPAAPQEPGQDQDQDLDQDLDQDQNQDQTDEPQKKKKKKKKRKEEVQEKEEKEELEEVVEDQDQQEPSKKKKKKRKRAENSEEETCSAPSGLEVNCNLKKKKKKKSKNQNKDELNEQEAAESQSVESEEGQKDSEEKKPKKKKKKKQKHVE